jgi:glycosyltransferase involved in cell wall biosynthesis
MMKKSVILRGPVLTQSGYGVHCRQLAKWLLSKPNIDVKFQLLPWGDTPWFINPDHDNGFIGKVMERTTDLGGTADVSVQLQLPNEWNTQIARHNVGLTAGVETDRCNPAWLNDINKMDTVIVPSTHVKKCFESTGKTNKQIHVVPESYLERLDHHENVDNNLFDVPTGFNFLVFGQLTGNNPYNDRKNTFFSIKWLCETFKDDKDVGIFVKTNTSRNTKIDRQSVLSIFNTMLSEVRKGPYPKVYLVHGDMNDDEVISLYKHPKIHALVSATRGEGYGLPLLEASVAGLPVIATNWSGHLDFLNQGRFISVDYKMENVHSSRIDNKIFLPGMQWAFPNEDDFKKKVLKFRQSPTIPKQWAMSLSEKLSTTHNFGSICSMYDAILGEVI